MRSTRLLLIALAAVLGGCGPVLSLYPLVGAKDAEPVTGVEGRWRDAEGATCEVVRDGATYHFAWVADGDSARVDVRFVRAGEHLLADVAGVGESGANDDPLVVPAHWVARARVDADSLRFDLLTEDWVKHHRGPFWSRVRTDDPGGAFVLTEPTAGLRRYAARAAHAPDAYMAWIAMGRERR